MITFTRDNKEFNASITPSNFNDGAPEMVANDRGVFLYDVIDGNKYVEVFKGYMPLETQKTIRLFIDRVVLSSTNILITKNETPDWKSTWGADIYERLEPIPHNAEMINKRVINSLLEKKGLAYLFNPMTLDVILDEAEATLVSPHLNLPPVE